MSSIVVVSGWYYYFLFLAPSFLSKKSCVKTINIALDEIVAKLVQYQYQLMITLQSQYHFAVLWLTLYFEVL